MENEKTDCDEFEKDLERELNEIDCLLNGLHELFDLCDVGEKLAPKVYEAESNFDEIKPLLEFIKSGNNDKNQCCAAVYCSILKVVKMEILLFIK